MIPSVYQKSIQQIRDTYNDYLRATPRYERFMEKETLPVWVALLGQDVCLLTHADETALIVEKCVTFTKTWTPDEQTSLILAAWIHDWGEIIIEGEGVGDVTFEKKDDAVQDVETSIFNQVISNLDNEEVRTTLDKIYQDVVLKRDPKLGEVFNLIERLGYLETALRAFKGIEGKRIVNWKGLSGNVLSNQIVKLVGYAPKYAYCKYFLDQEHEAIENIFAETLKTEHAPLDNTNNPSYDLVKLRHAYAVWKADYS